MALANTAFIDNDDNVSENPTRSSKGSLTAVLQLNNASMLTCFQTGEVSVNKVEDLLSRCREGVHEIAKTISPWLS